MELEKIEGEYTVKNKKVRNWKILISIILIILIICISFFFWGNTNELELQNIKSAQELEDIYEGKDERRKNVLLGIIGMPFSLLMATNATSTVNIVEETNTSMDSISPNISGSMEQGIKDTETSSKDYSTTNIQVENVDEADIIKTDGDYIYSISEDNVIITDVKNPEEIQIVAKLQLKNGSIPEDLMLYQNKLVVISTDNNNSGYNNNNTIVSIYDITNKETPRIIKYYELYEPYYTSRCIDNKLYVIASGHLRKEDNKMITYYTEDYEQKEIGFDHIQYLKDLKTNQQTLISMVDLNKPEEDVHINSYLMDISNAYISENNIYLLDQEFENNIVAPISSLFGWWGALGPNKYMEENFGEYGTYTKIFKFNILENGAVQYANRTKVKGKTINQYSIDEYEGNLRVALYDNDGSKIIIFDQNLNEIGRTPNLAKRENMYSSRFMGDKAYLVTYKTMDPLYVIDLSNATKPKVLGELKIPGYSTYLHPYDENHLIGIGMETEETVNRDYSGKVISTTAKIVGMKMALFDVSDVNNPIQISSVVIGDSRTSSAILTNPKALLFSKAKELIAIPVNNYQTDFEISNNSNNYDSIIDSYINYNKPYISEGYAVYGIKLKGMIEHEKEENYSYSSYYRNTTNLLRGLYIDQNLYTVSENQIKVNDLETLKLLDEIDIKE